MNKILRIALLVLAVLALSTAPASAARYQPGQMVPISGTVDGVDTLDFGAPGCPEGTAWRFNSSGTGTFSHLGRVDYVVTHCTVLNPDGFSGSFGHGGITLTAANRDTLVIAHQGTFQIAPDFSSANLEITSWWVVDGTGRFESATGHGTGSGVTIIPVGTSVHYDGVIAYDASNRSNR